MNNNAKYQQVKDTVKHIIPNDCFILSYIHIPPANVLAGQLQEYYWNDNDANHFGLYGAIYFQNIQGDIKSIGIGKELFDLFKSIEIELSNKQLEINVLRSLLTK